MKLTAATALVALGGVATVQALPPAQIYLHPAPSGASSGQSVGITSAEANAVLSHRLGISKYETLPKGLSAGSRKGQILFGDVGADLDDGQQQEDKMKVVMVVYGAGPQEVLPAALAKIAPLSLWSPPSFQSWDSLIAIYIGRLVHSLDVAIGSIFGVQDFVVRHGGSSLLDWASAWESKTHEWMRWGEEKLGIERTLMPQEAYSRWLTDFHIAGSSAQTLMGELVILDNYVESINSGSRPRLATLRFSGLLEIEARYSRVSRQYRGAAKLLNSVLSAAVNATLTAEPDATLVYISIPVVQQSYGRRTPGSLLAPFKTSENSFSSSAQLQRRSQVFAGRAPPSAVPIISSSRTSYSSEDECDKATGSCNGHGKCVQGRKTTGGQGYVCSCSSTTDDNGKSTSWSGETCQKQDISSDFVLLAGSTIGLLVLFAASVAILYDVGAEELPQQLASVSGASKKHD